MFYSVVCIYVYIFFFYIYIFIYIHIYKHGVLVCKIWKCGLRRSNREPVGTQRRGSGHGDQRRRSRRQGDRLGEQQKRSKRESKRVSGHDDQHRRSKGSPIGSQRMGQGTVTSSGDATGKPLAPREECQSGHGHQQMRFKVESILECKRPTRVRDLHV